MRQINKLKDIKKSLTNFNWLKTIKSATCLLIVAVILCSTGVMARADICQNFTGRENAEERNNFSRAQDQNIYKIWSMLKSYGMNDTQACAFLAVMFCEANCNPNTIEGDYRIAAKFNQKSRTSSFNEWWTEHRTEYTRKLLSTIYGVSDSDLDKAQKGHKYSKQYRVNCLAYFNKGKGACGIGLCQWTGPRTDGLLNFASKHNVKWYTMETQLTYIISDKKLGGDDYYSGIISRYKKDCTNKSLQECVNWLVDKYEGCPGATTAKKIRGKKASQFYLIMHGKSWDRKYGDKIVSGAGLTPVAPESGIQDRSILREYASPGIYYPRNGGFLLNTEDDLKKKNQEVYQGYTNTLLGLNDNSKTYSLFELYGEDLHWYRYMGESNFQPGLADHLYSGYNQNRIDELKNIQTIFYSANNYLSTQVYPERPRCLMPEEKKLGLQDPRTDAEVKSAFTGAPYVIGTLFMSISKLVCSSVSYLLGDKIIKNIASIFDALETKLTQKNIKAMIMPVIYLLFAFAAIALILSLVKKSVLYARGVSGAPRDIIFRFLISMLAMGLIFACIARPTVFNKVLVNIACGIDGYFNEALAESLQEDEVIAVQDKNMATEAALWKTCIFEPWCKGQFGLPYEQLYTQYADLSDADVKAKKAKYDQSHTTQQEAEAAKLTTEYYNSAQLTGDVFVPVGGGKKIRNWAAYLYSCGTDYHIDSTMVHKENVKETIAKWPIAKTTAGNTQLYADTFRVVDAQMNISPQYYTDGRAVSNYTNSRKLDTHYLTQGFQMLFNAMMLIFLIPAIYEKLKNFILLMSTIFQMIYSSFLELFKENTGFPEFTERFKKYFFGYFIAKIKIYAMVVSYYALVGKGFVGILVYMVVCVTILGLTVQNVSQFYRKTKYRVNMAAKRISGKRGLSKS